MQAVPHSVNEKFPVQPKPAKGYESTRDNEHHEPRTPNSPHAKRPEPGGSDNTYRKPVPRQQVENAKPVDKGSRFALKQDHIADLGDNFWERVAPTKSPKYTHHIPAQPDTGRLTTCSRPFHFWRKHSYGQPKCTRNDESRGAAVPTAEFSGLRSEFRRRVSQQAASGREMYMADATQRRTHRAKD